jgi:Tol biopolymer transport system component
VVLWKDAALHYLSNDSTDWPQWSPDGTRLVFMAIRGPGRPPAHVWVVGADGRGLKRVA